MYLKEFCFIFYKLFCSRRLAASPVNYMLEAFNCTHTIWKFSHQEKLFNKPVEILAFVCSVKVI